MARSRLTFLNNKVTRTYFEGQASLEEEVILGGKLRSMT
jgi:hypothetical protein